MLYKSINNVIFLVHLHNIRILKGTKQRRLKVDIPLNDYENNSKDSTDNIHKSGKIIFIFLFPYWAFFILIKKL